MFLNLSGKKAIVTGGGSGLCKGMAQALHDAGAEVVLVSHTMDTYDTANEMGSEGAKVHAVVGDLSAKSKLDKIYEECLEKLLNVFLKRAHLFFGSVVLFVSLFRFVIKLIFNQKINEFRLTHITTVFINLPS